MNSDISCTSPAITYSCYIAINQYKVKLYIKSNGPLIDAFFSQGPLNASHMHHIYVE